MESYTKFGYVDPIRFRVIGKKPHGGPKWPPTRAKVKLATYSATDSATSNKSLQNTYIGRSRRADHEYSTHFAIGQTVGPPELVADGVKLAT